MLYRNQRSDYVASQFETLTEIGRTDISRFGYLINGFKFYHGQNYQPKDEPGRQGA